MSAGRKVRGEFYVAPRRQIVEQIRADADDVSFAGFAARMLPVDHVAEIAGVGPRLRHDAALVEAADHDRLFRIGHGTTQMRENWLRRLLCGGAETPHSGLAFARGFMFLRSTARRRE